MFWAWGPYVAAGIVAPLAAKYVFEVYKERIGKPSMETKSYIRSWHSPISNGASSAWGRVTGASKPSRGVYKPAQQMIFDDVTSSTRNIVKNGGDFEWLLLFGPPGTGKSLLGEQIARESGLNFFTLSAAELSVHISKKTHVYELNKFLNKVERNGPAVLFLDEFDAIGATRDKLDQAHTEILSTLLTRTTAGSKRIMLIGVTNREPALDPAIINRFTYRVKVDLPDHEERVKILYQYINQFFTKAEINQFFTLPRVRELSQAIEGFPGRSIYLMLNAIRNKKATTSNGKLTQVIINQKVNQFIQQGQEEKQGDVAVKKEEKKQGD